jgi:hypothetical protein
MSTLVQESGSMPSVLKCESPGASAVMLTWWMWISFDLAIEN